MAKKLNYLISWIKIIKFFVDLSINLKKIFYSYRELGNISADHRHMPCKNLSGINVSRKWFNMGMKFFLVGCYFIACTWLVSGFLLTWTTIIINLFHKAEADNVFNKYLITFAYSCIPTRIIAQCAGCWHHFHII